MTDAEKELRRLAEEAKRYDATSEGSFRAKSRMWGALSPAAVLDLLDRIEALEEQVGEAERNGAEEMRRHAANMLKGMADQQHEIARLWGVEGAVQGVACVEKAATLTRAKEAVEGILLPGDAP